VGGGGGGGGGGGKRDTEQGVTGDRIRRSTWGDFIGRGAESGNGGGGGWRGAVEMFESHSAPVGGGEVRGARGGRETRETGGGDIDEEDPADVFFARPRRASVVLGLTF